MARAVKLKLNSEIMDSHMVWENSPHELKVHSIIFRQAGSFTSLFSMLPPGNRESTFYISIFVRNTVWKYAKNEGKGGGGVLVKSKRSIHRNRIATG